MARRGKFIGLLLSPILFIGCQDEYVQPDLTLPQLVAKVRHYHGEVELRAKAPIDSIESNGLHHSMHEIEGILQEIGHFSRSHEYSPERFSTITSAAQGMAVIYRKMDDAYHSSKFKLNYDAYAEPLSKELERLDSLVSIPAPDPTPESQP